MSSPEQRPRSLPTQIAAAGATTFGILGVNFGTGLVVARFLGPAGRGETAVVTTFALILGFLAAFGMNEGMTYLTAKRPEDGPQIVGTSLALIVILGTIGVVVAEILLPALLSAQDESLLPIARLYVLTIYVAIAASLLLHVLAGAQQFGAVNTLRFLQPAVYLVALVAFAVAGRLTVGTALVSSALSIVVGAIFTLLFVMRFASVGRPSFAIARQAARYGLRAQGLVLGGIANSRLDFLVLPSILPAAAIGLYSVAVNTTSILILMAGALGTIVLPVAASRGGRAGSELVARMLRLTVLIGVLIGVPLFVAAPLLLRLVYGPDFVDAAPALRILVPGAVAAMGSRVVERGLQAANRPFAAGVGQLVALVVTIVGLLLTLRTYGIEGAAATTSVAYATAFVIGLRYLRQDEHFSLSEVCSVRGLRADVARVTNRLSSRRERAAPPTSEAP